ncbi:melanoma-associated antigen 8-like [Mesoplodon densirostris]|uniref:melanoma-associated antigen 8-like n=1 Tax=Mesoplodon densirostris TaxID=48708 RepID=UPI0028DB1FA8|nr:melanoma-associated antigen 8-like [Mesoplodon densirostris]
MSTGLQEPGGEGPSLRTVSSGHRAEEAQAVPGVKGSLAGDRPPRRSAPVRPEGTPEDETCPWSLPVAPAHTPVGGGPTPVIMCLVRMCELCQREIDLHAPVPAQGLVEAQLLGAEEDEAVSLSSFSSYSDLFLGSMEEVADAGEPSPPLSPSHTAMAMSPWSQSEDDGLSPQDEEGPSTWHDQEDVLQHALHQKVDELVGLLLLKYHTKEPTTKAEMLSILNDYQDHFPVVFSQACKCMQLVFGVEVKEVELCERTYVLGPILGLTCDTVLSNGPSMPKAGLLVLVLGLILLEGDCAPEEAIWGVLANKDLSAGRRYYIHGEVRELLTKVWVQEGYVVYRQVPHSDPARYEFLWGPRAHAEASKCQVLEHLLWVNAWDPRFFPSLSAEGVCDEEQGA